MCIVNWRFIGRGKKEVLWTYFTYLYLRFVQAIKISQILLLCLLKELFKTLFMKG